ncbi:MAG: glycoside hydrolase family 2 protein [Armatimonadota bacterium]
MSIPRSEYPRPQFVRSEWHCLNGEWEFETDSGDSGLERGVRDRSLSGTIQVPFCPESRLSGVENTDFLTAVWYRRTVTIPAEWSGRSVLLHFHAVDYDATVCVNGVEVGRHRGGFTPFACDLRGVASPGDTAVIVVRARDTRDLPQPRGKQSTRHGSYACFYTRTTGIWQSVWMEPVPEVALRRPRITPDVAGRAFHLELPLSANRPGHRVRARLADDSGTISSAEVRADLDLAPRLSLSAPADRVRLWEPGNPCLVDIELEIVDAEERVVDRATAYAGLRSVSIDGRKVRINGKAVFQRLVLDQGYWPESVMTAPSDAELVADIERSLAAGFNGARLHQKVFEERFLFHADRLGYLVWGEFGDWGCSGNGPDWDHQQPGASYIVQWLEAMERDYSHPSIVGWCPLNETYQVPGDRIVQLDDVTRGMFLATKAMDTSRPVLDTSGYAHRVPESDIYDSHDYEQDVEKFRANQAGLADGKPFINKGWDGKETNIGYRGQPYFCSEFGGIWWNPAAFANRESWGYGERVTSLEEWHARFQGLCDVLLDDPEMFGYCYTQLTDIWPEENGIYTFDRQPKFDLERLRAVQCRPAASEREA